MSGYSDGGASTLINELKAWLPNSLSPQSDIDLNLRTLRNRSADLVMNFALGHAAITTSARSVIGSGLRVFPRLNSQLLNISDDDARAWSKRTAAEFQLWADNCDFFKRNSFGDLQYIAYVSYLTYGDSFCLFKRVNPTFLQPYSLRLQLVESNRVSNPYSGDFAPIVKARDGKNLIVNGVELNPDGIAVAFWISNNVPNDLSLHHNPTKWIRVKARNSDGRPNILHIAHDSRPNQVRGVPFLAPVILPLKQLSRFVNAELTSEIIKSYFTLFFTGTPSGTRDLDQILPSPYEKDSDSPVVDPSNYKVGPGIIGALPPGVGVETVQSNSSSSTFDSFLSNLSQHIGAALGIPKEILLKSFNSSYSASRAALIQFFEEVKVRRNWFIRDFCKPIYDSWLLEAVSIGRINAPGFFDDPLTRQLWSDVQFFGPTMAVLDPVKEVQAAERRINLGLTSHEQEAMELSGNIFDDNLNILKQENKLLTPDVHA